MGETGSSKEVISLSDANANGPEAFKFIALTLTLEIKLLSTPTMAASTVVSLIRPEALVV